MDKIKFEELENESYVTVLWRNQGSLYKQRAFYANNTFYELDSDGCASYSIHPDNEWILHNKYYMDFVVDMYTKYIKAINKVKTVKFEELQDDTFVTVLWKNKGNLYSECTYYTNKTFYVVDINGIDTRYTHPDNEWIIACRNYMIFVVDIDVSLDDVPLTEALP